MGKKEYTIVIYHYRDGMREYEEQFVRAGILTDDDLPTDEWEYGERIVNGYVVGYLTSAQYRMGRNLNLC
tara:strand:+ start:169 stop:378 length:210 start_codon:yes stop_codon:yes gene_type:complete